MWINWKNLPSGRKKALCCTLEAALCTLVCMHHRGCLFWFLHRCFITFPHLSLGSFPNCVCFTHVSPSSWVYYNQDTLCRNRLLNAKISSADHSGTSYQPLSYNDNMGPAEDKQLAVFISLSVMVSVMRVRWGKYSFYLIFFSQFPPLWSIYFKDECPDWHSDAKRTTKLHQSLRAFPMCAVSFLPGYQQCCPAGEPEQQRSGIFTLNSW